MSSEIRRKIQKSLITRGESITYGDTSTSPIPLEVLKSLHKHHPLVAACIDTGLTAEILKIKYNDIYYCLKKKRNEIFVQNEDGQLSFLNEILCRKTIEKHRSNSIINKGISRTYYADLKSGLILTEWLEGDHPTYYNRKRFRSTLLLLNELEKIGLFEWDLCSGNLIYRDDTLVLFDFGYMYAMNQKIGINSEQMTAPVFHSVERFETRTLMGYLLNQSMMGFDILPLFRILKEEAVEYYKTKVAHLIEIDADLVVIQYYSNLITSWQTYLNSDVSLNRLYLLDSSRSFALDIHDDLTGKTCTNHTLIKIDKMIETIQSNYDLLKKSDGIMWFDLDYDQEALIALYGKRKELAKQYQIENFK